MEHYILIYNVWKCTQPQIVNNVGECTANTSKNSKGEQKKYKGFGETKEIKEDKAKRQEEKERKKAAMKAKMKKAEVTRDEAALMAELLQAGTS